MEKNKIFQRHTYKIHCTELLSLYIHLRAVVSLHSRGDVLPGSLLRESTHARAHALVIILIIYYNIMRWCWISCYVETDRDRFKNDYNA